MFPNEIWWHFDNTVVCICVSFSKWNDVLSSYMLYGSVTSEGINYARFTEQHA